MSCILCLPSIFFYTSFQFFFELTGMRQNHLKKDWFLSKEEFQLWSRRYRLRDSDEIKEIVLPQVQFLSLQSEENRPVS